MKGGDARHTKDTAGMAWRGRVRQGSTRQGRLGRAWCGVAGHGRRVVLQIEECLDSLTKYDDVV